jgi:dolichol-phosphate mannosyltransferase
LRPFDVVQAAAAAVVLARLARGRHRFAPLRPGDLAAGTTVSVVVPARDEAERIRPCLEGVCVDPQVTEVLVVDDRSVDATAAISRSAGAKVLPGVPPPPGWAGRQWALARGVAAASGDWVMALDASTRPEPGLIGAATSAATEQAYDLLTVGPRFECGGTAAQLAHASMLATLVYRFGPLGSDARPPAVRLAAAGECLLFRRELLADGVGFGATRGHANGGVALARWVAARGGRIGFLDGTDLLAVRARGSPAAVWRERARALAFDDLTPPAWQAADLALVWLTMALPAVRLLSGRGTPLDAGLLALRACLSGTIRRSYATPRAGVWLSPLADLAAAAGLTRSTILPTRIPRARTQQGAVPSPPPRSTHEPGHDNHRRAPAAAEYAPGGVPGSTPS